MPELPPRWSHARFLEELVYHLIFPRRSKTKVSVDTDSTSNTSTLAPSICSFSVFGQQQNVNGEGLYDLRSSICRSEYLNTVPTIRMTKGAFEGNYFRHCLDGMRHNWIPAKESDHYQYCYYKLMNEYEEFKRHHFPTLRQNRSHIMRCLVYHVNLCP
jgi:hypothetical protein